MVTYSLLAANQVMSLIFDGVFDRYPTLRIVFVEHAFNWILPLMWRMDAIYEARKSGWTSSASPASTSRTTSSSPPSRWTIRRQDRTAAGLRVDGVREDPAVLLGLPALDVRRPALAGQAPTEHAREAVMFRNGIETQAAGDGSGAGGSDPACSEPAGDFAPAPARRCRAPAAPAAVARPRVNSSIGAW
jgi:hypothetical protein